MNGYVKGVLIAAVSAIVLAGCEGTLDKKDSETPAEVTDKTTEGSRTTTGSSESTTTTRPFPSASGPVLHPLDDPNQPLLQERIVYFDFDSATVRAQDRDIVQAHANYLASDPSASVTLEGHADERGSREYNIGLGERRAQSVGRLLTLLGVSDGQVRTVSFGEERPAAYGTDESSLSRNRRVELNYER